MLNKFYAVTALALLVGCGPNLEQSCENYVDAWAGCMDEAYADDTTSLEAAKTGLDGTCDIYSGQSGKAAKEAAELLDCYATTIEAGDCSSGDAYLTTVADITSCVTGL